MKINLLTFPKILLGLFFVLMTIASFYFSYHSIIYLLIKHWLTYIFLFASIYYLFSTIFKSTNWIQTHPITSFASIPISIIILISDYLLFNAILTSDRDSYKTIYMIGLIILFFWIPIGLAFLSFLDFLFDKLKNK